MTQEQVQAQQAQALFVAMYGGTDDGSPSTAMAAAFRQDLDALLNVVRAAASTPTPPSVGRSGEEGDEAQRVAIWLFERIVQRERNHLDTQWDALNDEQRVAWMDDAHDLLRAARPAATAETGEGLLDTIRRMAREVPEYREAAMRAIEVGLEEAHNRATAEDEQADAGADEAQGEIALIEWIQYDAILGIVPTEKVRRVARLRVEARVLASQKRAQADVGADEALDEALNDYYWARAEDIDAVSDARTRVVQASQAALRDQYEALRHAATRAYDWMNSDIVDWDDKYKGRWQDVDRDRDIWTPLRRALLAGEPADGGK